MTDLSQRNNRSVKEAQFIIRSGEGPRSTASGLENRVHSPKLTVPSPEKTDVRKDTHKWAQDGWKVPW